MSEALKMIQEYFADDPFFIDHPLGPHSVAIDGDSILHRAIQRRSIEIVSALIELGADVTMRGDMGNTALHYAVQKDFFVPEIFKSLCPEHNEMSLKNEFDQDVYEWAKSSGNTLNIVEYVSG